MPQSKRNTITLKDVAGAAGCSKAVVSTVLNGARGNIGVSEDMKRRVTEAAQRLGYQPNFASQSLALKRTRTLGIYIDPLYGGGIAGHYHAAILSGIEAACSERGYDVLLVNFTGQASVGDCIEKIARARIDGLLLLHTGRNERLIDAVLEATQFVVAIDSLDPPDRLQAVCYDHQLAVRLAVEHLVGLGHRRIGYAGTFTTRPIPHNAARAAAFRAVMAELGQPLDERRVFTDDRTQLANRYPEYTAAHILAQITAMPEAERPTAMVVYNDKLAIGLIQEFAEAGLSVPGDISLVNFENTPIGQVVTPRLTCLDHPVTQMSHRAADRLVDVIESNNALAEPAEPWHIVFKPELLIHQSTSSPRHDSA